MSGGWSPSRRAACSDASPSTLPRKDAQATGLPGKYGTTHYLTRLTDRRKIKENRDKACPTSLVRPPDKSCDEYPFASTRQGA
ncbi:NucA/NucB deoxyribonuclease domain-containing protein [Streptomyces luteogriseus]